MKPTYSARLLTFAALCSLAVPAAAHTGHATVDGFAAGLAHPLTGLDHLLAMVAIGLWAAQQGGRALWAMPVAFIGTMLVGHGLALAGLPLPHAQTGIAVSVVVLGLLVASRQQWAVAAGAALSGGFALFHGYAHGLELPQAASPALYALGFAIATAVLHAAGIAGSFIGHRAVLAAGAAVAASGLAMLFGIGGMVS